MGRSQAARLLQLIRLGKSESDEDGITNQGLGAEVPCSTQALQAGCPKRSESQRTEYGGVDVCKGKVRFKQGRSILSQY